MRKCLESSQHTAWHRIGEVEPGYPSLRKNNIGKARVQVQTTGLQLLGVRVVINYSLYSSQHAAP